jgi:hypothetical protein
MENEKPSIKVALAPIKVVCAKDDGEPTVFYITLPKDAVCDFNDIKEGVLDHFKSSNAENMALSFRLDGIKKKDGTPIVKIGPRADVKFKPKYVEEIYVQARKRRSPSLIFANEKENLSIKLPIPSPSKGERDSYRGSTNAAVFSSPAKNLNVPVSGSPEHNKNGGNVFFFTPEPQPNPSVKATLTQGLPFKPQNMINKALFTASAVEVNGRSNNNSPQKSPKITIDSTQQTEAQYVPKADYDAVNEEFLKLKQEVEEMKKWQNSIEQNIQAVIEQKVKASEDKLLNTFQVLYDRITNYADSSELIFTTALNSMKELKGRAFPLDGEGVILPQ